MDPESPYIKSTLNHCKTNNGRNFRLQNSHLLTFPHRQKKSFQERRLWQIFQLSIFVLSREKCHHQGHRTSLSVSDTNFLCFSSHNPDWDWWGLWQSCTKDKWLISSWYQTCQKLFWHMYCCGFSQGWKCLYNTAVYMTISIAITHYSEKTKVTGPIVISRVWLWSYGNL